MKKQNIIISRVKFLTGLTLFGALFLSVFVFLNWRWGYYAEMYIELGMIGVLLLAIFLVRIKKYEYFSIVLGTLVVLWITLQNFLLGGYEGTGAFLMFLYPIIMFILHGSKRGVIWIAFLLACMWGMVFAGMFGHIEIYYSVFATTMLTVSLAVVAALNFTFERSQEKSYNLIQKQAQDLEENRQKLTKQNRKMQKTLDEIEEKRGEIEEINRLMVGRELKMSELKDKLKAKEN